MRVRRVGWIAEASTTKYLAFSENQRSEGIQTRSMDAVPIRNAFGDLRLTQTTVREDSVRNDILSCWRRGVQPSH